MKLIHHGAHEGVTGSCHELNWGDRHGLLVDCGIFQGDEAKKHPTPEINFALTKIESMLLTHVHIDHAGRIPYLLAAGFKQPIYCSHPTAELLPLVMEDALKIGFTRSRNLVGKFLRQVKSLLQPLDYDTWHNITGGASLRLRPAGHVLGSSIFEVRLPDGKTVVFSGDIGTGKDPLLRPPTSPPNADLLVLESTYGDKNHESPENRQLALEQVLRRTLEDRGVTIIPAFSLGRTQAILYEMNGIFERIQKQSGRSLLKQVDVIVDSPLASRFTELYKSMNSYWGRESQQLMLTDDQPLVFENLTTVGSHQEHKETLAYIAEKKLPAIVIAGSGMCTGGRVLNYLKRFLNEATTDIIFAGHQANGTPGHFLGRGCDWVRLNGKKYEVAAKVHRMHGYSAHADQTDLIDFVQNMETRPKQIRLVHGNYQPKLILAEKLTNLGYEIV